MKFYKKNLAIFSFFLIFQTTFIISSCHSMRISREGTVATQEENIVLLEGGPHEGTWQTPDLIVSYSYTSQPDSFRIKGEVNLGDRLKKSFTTVNHFSVRANLLSEEKRILKSFNIIIWGNQVIRTWGFDNSVPPPDGMKAMNFSYSGVAAEGGGISKDGNDRISISFWKNP